MRVRNVLKEFEAHIGSVQPKSKIEGKSEWKQYGDGTYRFKVSIRKIGLPNDSRIDLHVVDVRVMQLTVQDGNTKADLESSIQVGIPKVQAGQVLQILFGETALAEGIYKEE